MSSAVRTPVQIAWVTSDIDATECTLTALMGAKKWVRIPGVHFAPDTCTYRGQPADFVADISVSYAGDMQLELIAPRSGASVYSEFLRDRGPGLHHVCIEADSPDGMTRILDEATAAGAPVVMQGSMPGGMEFAYISAAESGVPYLEIAFISPEMKGLFDYIKQEQK
jgi:catechol 2,3-dioxygenase-like lactoylglutathione lyase family enzyme